MSQHSCETETLKTETISPVCLIVCCAFVYRAEPDYYDAVTTPMDLSMIQQKLKTEEYDDVEQMSADVQLIVSNAKAVYGVSSSHMIIISNLLTPGISSSSSTFLSPLPSALVLVQVQVLVLDLSGPTSLRFGLGTFLGPDVSVDKEELVKFWKSCASTFGSRNF